MKGKVLLAIVVVGMFVSVAISPAYVNASLTLYDIRNGIMNL